MISPSKSPQNFELGLSRRDLMHVLTNTIGMAGAVGPQIDVERIQLLDRDAVLVCTNGLTDHLSEEVIAGVLASPQSPDRQCQALADLSREADDDVTTLVAHYRIPDGTPP